MTLAKKALAVISLMFAATSFTSYQAFSSEPDQSSKNNSFPVSVWITDPSQNILFSEQQVQSTDDSVSTVIEIHPEQKFQQIDGFGWCLTGGSATLIHKMSPDRRATLLKELFATNDNNIGGSYLRISIGASDLSDHVFTYNDLPSGETDPEMKKFSIEPEKEDLIPVLKEILAINPEIKILGSPWSPPTWMKTNNNSKGGSLKPEWYDAYANYFVKYIQSMAAEGITIDAITVQNEPLHPGNNPSLLMPAEEQSAFIKRSLGPAFSKSKIDTKIIVYDHNADRPDYPLTIFSDRDAAQYVDGSAFHLYNGKIEALSEVHNAFPEKNLYFTEQWVGAPGNLAADLMWHTQHLTIGATRNWCRVVLEWNLAADPDYNPHTMGGCTECLGAVTIDGDRFTRNPAYYIIAHAAKFVRPGSVRIDSNMPEGLDNVAFNTPDGKIVLIVANSAQKQRSFVAKTGDKEFSATLNPGVVATFVW